MLVGQEPVVTSTQTRGRASPEEDPIAAGLLAGRLLVPRRDNFVPRPWGGRRLREFKRLAPAADAIPIGEAFEIAADDRDEEAREHPSRIAVADGVEASLPALLDARAQELLGRDFVARHGPRFPLLPKTLDIAELLSVQGHPEGNTEVYVVIAADAGATIRLGFAEDVDARAFGAELASGRRDQRRLLDLCAPDTDQAALRSVLKPWLASRVATAQSVETDLRALLPAAAAWTEVERLLGALHRLYWRVLDSMNVIPVTAGQVIHNATPVRIASAIGRAPSAEVHALGNPEGREVLLLEIRRPGPTFRAWDNVRFPLRDVDTAGALASLSTRRTAPEEFIVTPQPVPGRPGVGVSVASEVFRVEHLAPTRLRAVEVPAEPPHSLHVIEGEVSVYATDGALVGRLARGESALVPIGVGAYRIAADSERAALVKAGVPAGV
jgi:hypothetical protein